MVLIHTLHYSTSALTRELYEITTFSARMCALDSRSFATLEGKGFVQFIDVILDLQSKKQKKLSAAELLSIPNTISSHVSKLADSVRKDQRSTIRQVVTESGGCVTMDFWSERYTKTAFFSMTFHFIKDSQLVQEHICCAEYDPYRLVLCSQIL